MAGGRNRLRDALLGAYVAAQKHRPTGEGLTLGFLFGPLGVLIVALLPQGAARPVVRPPTPRRSSPIQEDLDPELTAFVEDQIRKAMDARDGAWNVRPYRDQRALFRDAERRVGRFALAEYRRLTKSELADLSRQARRSILGR